MWCIFEDFPTRDNIQEYSGRTRGVDPFTNIGRQNLEQLGKFVLLSDQRLLIKEPRCHDWLVISRSRVVR